jgi:hypothetical protein
MKEWLQRIDPNITLISAALLFLLVFLLSGLQETKLAEIKSKAPIIQQVGVPFYFTNTIILIVPTNSIPLTNVISKP